MKILVINHQADCNAERFQPWLEEAGFQIDNRLGPAGQLPNHIHYSTDSPASDHFAAVIIAGGDANVGDEPHSVWWFPQVEQLIIEATAQRIPVLGLCLGAQLIAHALGGQIDSCNNQLKYCTKPYEFGVADIHLSKSGQSDLLFKGLGSTISMHENHQAYIKQLPDRAELLASSDRCPIEAFRYGCYTYGLQFHPEANTETVNNWTKKRVNELIDAGIDWSLVIKRASHFMHDNEAASRQICHNFAQIIRRRSKLS